MRGSRAAAVVTGLGAAGALALGLADCAEPTQIVLEVTSDACEAPGRTTAIHQTGIAVGTPGDIDDKPPSALRDGCESPPRVGTLTIYPSGGKDEEIAIKVVAGVEAMPDQCRPPGYAGCIAHRRVMRFVPRTTQRVTIRLSLACLNRTCAAGRTCDNGLCVDPSDVLPDGTTRPDASAEEAGVTGTRPWPDAGADASPPPPQPDAGPDPCVGCIGDCDDAGCAVDCSKVRCATSNVCAPTLPCSVTCPDTSSCKDLLCETSGKCTILCGSRQTACGKVVCSAGACEIECKGAGSCDGDGGILIDAAALGKLTCDGDLACKYASCNAGQCELACRPGNGSNHACPTSSARPCSSTSDCTKWDNPTVF